MHVSPQSPARARPPPVVGSYPKGDRMSLERPTGRRYRLRTTLAVLGLIGSSLALSIPARAFDDTIVDPTDKTPTEKYVPKAGYTPGARTPGRLTPSTGALFGVHADEMTQKQVQVTDAKGNTRNFM